MTGLLRILRFNWHLYAIAAALDLAIIAAAAALSGPARIALVAALAPGMLWPAASLAVSHQVYDRSALYRWRWLGDLRLEPAAWVSIHAGLDDVSAALAHRYGASSGRVLDIFDPDVMTEPSIARARREQPRRAERADYRCLPIRSREVDAVFVVFAAHELRSRVAKERLFAEAARALRRGGRLVLVEHLRDAWNLAAFGPGCLHFFSARTWRSTMAAAGLHVCHELAITPFVRVFVAEPRQASP